MSKTFEPSPQQALWFICGLCLAAVLLGVAAGRGAFSAEMAAWLQAVGSLAALLGVWWSTTVTSRRQALDEASRRLRSAEVIHHVGRQLQALVSECSAQHDASSPRISDHTFDSVVFSLNELRIQEAPSQGIAVGLLNLRQVAGSLRTAYGTTGSLSQLTQLKKTTDDVMETIRGEIEVLKRRVP